MLLPRRFEITNILKRGKDETLSSLKSDAVLVYPPEFIGQVHSGQGADH
jgi:hypothetical protein